MYLTARRTNIRDHGAILQEVLGKAKAEIRENEQQKNLMRLEFKLKQLRQKQERLKAKVTKGHTKNRPVFDFKPCYELFHGFSAEKRPDGKLTIVFRPVNSKGEILGPYDVVLARTESDSIRVESYVLPKAGNNDFQPEVRKMIESGDPAVIPIRDLEKECLSEPEAKVDQFAQAVSTLLSAYIRRLCQVCRMADRFPEEVQNVMYSKSLSQVKFVVVLQIDGDDDDEEDINIEVCLKYDLDKIRPKSGSVKVKILTTKASLDEDVRESLHNQKNAFYNHDLDEAIDLAFH